MTQQTVILTCGHCGEGNDRRLPYDMAKLDICGFCNRIFTPVPMILTCPLCNARHIDEGVFAHKPHHTHACQSCGMVWRPSKEFTSGVQFLPGYKS